MEGAFDADRITVAKILKPHGLRGLVRVLMLFEDSSAVFSCSSLFVRNIEVRMLPGHSLNKGMFVVRLMKISRNVEERIDVSSEDSSNNQQIQSVLSLLGKDQNIENNNIGEVNSELPTQESFLMNTCEDAATWRGESIFADRDALPKLDDDEFYTSDLIGLPAHGTSGKLIGEVYAIHNFGASDIIELSGGAMIPFTKSAVPVVENGKIVINEEFLP